MIEVARKWFVVQTHVHAEEKASAHLRRQGFEVYLPRYLKRRRHARRVEIVPSPLFPRYLFVAFDRSMQRWRSIQSTVGVVHLIRFGEDATAVADSVVAELRGREDERGFVRIDLPRLAQGDKVRIACGAFAEALGLFENFTDNERVAILLDLLGRKVRVVLDATMVEAA